MVEKMQLQELKKTFDAKRLSKENYVLLLQQREEIYDQIVEHQELDSLKEELKELDHQIDELGENQEEEIEKLKEEIVMTIQQIFPESTHDYQELCTKFDTHQNEEKSCLALSKNLSSFAAALNEGAASKNARGFFGFIFGRNHKVILARAIRKAIIEAERIYEQIDDETIQHFLTTFLKEANSPWNSALYRERFFELHHEFSGLMEKLEERKILSRRNSIKVEKKIEIWIEHYCRK